MNLNELNENQKKFNTLLEYHYYKQDIKEEGEEEETTEIEDEEVVDGSMELDDEQTPTDDIELELSDEEVVDEPMDNEMEMGGEEASVEIDVTDVVNDTKDIKRDNEEVKTALDDVIEKLNNLETLSANLDSVTNKVNNLGKEIEKRVPTPKEKITLRSLSSFPYNTKMNDYWDDVNGYEASPEDEVEKEYILTQSDVDAEYNEQDMNQNL